MTAAGATGAAPWRPRRTRQVYAEDGGFVLLDPERLQQQVPGARGSDLLALFSTTDLGDRVAREGTVVPVLGVEPGWYDLQVQPEGAPDPEGTPVVSAGGFVLETTSGELHLGPLASLRAWDPDDLRHTWVSVPPGTYAVELRGFTSPPGRALRTTGAYAWVLRATPARPWFTADLG